MAKKKKVDIDTRLFLIRNIKKTFKYYFKTILYILLTNIILIYGFFKFLRPSYYGMMLDLFSTKNYTIFGINKFINISSFKLFYITSLLLIMISIKVIFYGNVITTIKKNGINDVKELLKTVLRRFLPTVGTYFLYIIIISFFTLLAIIPGIVFFFYYYFSLFLTGIGDLNNKEKNAPKLLNATSAMSRSYVLVKHNLIRFSILTIIMIAITFLLDKYLFIFFAYINLKIKYMQTYMIKFCIYDILIIYSAVMYTKFQGIENDVIEEEFRSSQEEQRLLNQASVNQAKNFSYNFAPTNNNNVPKSNAGKK